MSVHWNYESSTTVRISSELHELLKSLADESAVSMQEILREALERLRRERHIEGTILSHWGSLHRDTLEKVEDILRILLDSLTC